MSSRSLCRLVGRLRAISFPSSFLYPLSLTYTSSRSCSFRSHDQQKDLVCSTDPDTFGYISRTHNAFADNYFKDEDDKKEEKYLSERPLPSARLSTKRYADMIKDHLKHKRLKEALDILEVKMLQEDRAKPEDYIYNLLISGCASVGYTKKAFMLFNDMKRRSIKPTGGTYTSLFNACSNSPWPAEGLQRANGLRELMIEKQIEPNLTNYNAMIKAFGRCGDLVTAFQIADEMHTKKIKIRVHTFNFLLQACISDKNTGFRHALLTWRKMLKVREKPNVYSFNLILKCVKECSIGNAKFDFGDLLPEFSLDDNKLLNGVEKPIIAANMNSNESQNIIKMTDHEDTNIVVSTNQLPNLLSQRPHMGSVISINQVKKPAERFMLIGGADGFFKEMTKYDVKPDIKTLTLVLQVLPDTTEAESKLLECIKALKIKTDIDFYNMLIKKRCFRYDYESANSVMLLIDEENKRRDRGIYTEKRKLVRPDIVTYGVLALSCDNLQSARELLKTMKDKRIKLNSEILGTLIRHAVAKHDLEFIFYIMKAVRDENISINTIFLKHLKKIDFEKLKFADNSPEAVDNLDLKNKYFVYFKEWKNNVLINETDETEHPWTQFRVNQPEPFQHIEREKIKHATYKRIPKQKPKYKIKI